MVVLPLRPQIKVKSGASRSISDLFHVSLRAANKHAEYIPASTVPLWNVKVKLPLYSNSPLLEHVGVSGGKVPRILKLITKWTWAWV